MASLVDESTLDVCIERLSRQHPRAQLFIFAGKGEPFWARYAPLQSELDLLPSALRRIEAALEKTPAPLVGADPGGQFSFLVVDAEATWFAVVFGAASTLNAETRTARGAGKQPTPRGFQPVRTR